MRLAVVIGFLAILNSVTIEGHKRKKYHKHRRTSHHGASYRRGQFPRSDLGRHGPFGLHGSHGPPPRHRPTHDNLRRPWLDSYEAYEASSEYDIYSTDSSWESSSGKAWRRPCSSRRCPPKKPPCQRNTTPLPIQTSPTIPTKDWWAENRLKSTSSWWETVLSWSTTRPTHSQVRELITNSEMNSTTVSPEETTILQHIIDCVTNCSTTPEFHPVCGTDDVTYQNIGSLFCAKTCGVNVELRRASVCPPPRFPDYEDGEENGEGDAPVSGDDNRNDNGTSQLTTPSPTTPPPTINPRFLFKTTFLTRFQQCMKTCPIKSNYNPICGTDLVTYLNFDRMICARGCGQDVEVLCEKPCALCTWQTTSTTTTTTPRTMPQSTTTHRAIPQSTARVNDDVRTTRASIELCFKACPITSEHNPVCGTNDVNYTNPGHLLCAQMCGEDVRLSRFGSCPSATESPTTTTEENYTLPPAILVCARTCRNTPEYNPVCGTNGETYFNIGQLECDKFCGVDVRLSYKGLCLHFLPPFLTSLAALAKMTTPIWKTSTFSTPTTSSTPLKIPLTQWKSTMTTSTITSKTPITSSWNTPTRSPEISESPITSPWNSPKTPSTALETPITSAWNTPVITSTTSNALKTSSWNTPITSTLLLNSPTTTPLTSIWNSESTISTSTSKDSSTILETNSWDSPITTPPTTSWGFPSLSSSNHPFTTSTSPRESLSTTPSTFSWPSSITVPTSSTWDSSISTPLETPSTTPSSKTLFTLTGDASSTYRPTQTPISEIVTVVDHTIPPDILASIFNISRSIETSTQPNIMTTAAEEDFSLDPRFGDNLEENVRRNDYEINSRIVFPDDR